MTVRARGGDDLIDAFDRNMVPVSLEPPLIVSGSGSWVTDAQGERYLDLVAGPGVVALGHSHPKVAEAIADQARLLVQSPGKFLTPPALEYARELARLAPGALTRTFFCNSGAEANEGAIKLAKKQAFLGGGGPGVISFEHSFHGRTTHALAMTGQTKYKGGLGTFLAGPGTIHVPYPHHLRVPRAVDCVEYVLDAIRDAVALRSQGGATAVLFEPIAAVGGVLIPPPEFLPALRELCDELGLLLIADEVYTGFGRTGTMFCCEQYGVAPDIMTLAKAAGGGLPLGAFVTTDELAAAFAESREHFTTFGANSAIACAAGRTAVALLEEERVPDRAARSGSRLLELLRERCEGLPHVLEVRGSGLLLGIEFGEDDRRRSPRPDLAKEVARRALEDRVLVSVSGSYDTVIRLSPPLTIGDDEIELAGELLGRIIQSVDTGARAGGSR